MAFIIQTDEYLRTHLEFVYLLFMYLCNLAIQVQGHQLNMAVFF